jgi:hypothetical protein
VVVYLPAPTADPSKPPKQITLHFGYMKDNDLLSGNTYVSSALARRNGERFTALVNVEARGDDVEIEVNLNGQPHLSARMSRNKMAPFAGVWATPGREELLGLGADDVHVRFHSFRIKMLNGRVEKKS